MSCWRAGQAGYFPINSLQLRIASELIHLTSYRHKKRNWLNVRWLRDPRLALAMSLVVSALTGTPALGEGKHQLNGDGSPRQKTSPATKPLHEQSREALVGNLVSASYEGCGCYFQLPSDRRARSQRYFFIADLSHRAWMNIAGEDVELHLIGSSHLSLRSKKGERMDFRFEAASIHVRVRMLVSRTSTYEADYEPARYAITVQVTKGKRSQTVRTTGSCGC